MFAPLDGIKISGKKARIYVYIMFDKTLSREI